MAKTVEDFPPAAMRDYEIGDEASIDVGSITLRMHRHQMRNGGKRLYWRCDGCERRVTALYLRSGSYRCRTCHELVYRVQLESRQHRQRRHAMQRETRKELILVTVRQLLTLLELTPEPPDSGSGPVAWGENLIKA